jgi:hypothetical protein
MGEKEIGELITHPAKNEKVSATTIVRYDEF